MRATLALAGGQLDVGDRPLVYLDTSVALAHLLSEDRRPPEALWRRSLVSSRLLHYEMTVRLSALAVGEEVWTAGRALWQRVATLDLVAPVLESLSSLPTGHLRTLDALHLTSVRFLVDQDVPVEIATYDRRLANAAEQAGLAVADWI